MGMIVLLARVLGAVHRRHVAVLLTGAIALTVLWGALFAATQKLPFTTGLYWAITTATTVGYGDVSPHNTAGRVAANAGVPTTNPTPGALFSLPAGAAVLDRVRRLFGLDTSLPHSAYTIVFGTHDIIPRVLEVLARTGDP